MWLYVAWKLCLYCRLFHSCYQAHYWSDTVKTNTLCWRNQQDSTSGSSQPRKTHLCCTPQQRQEDTWHTHTHTPDIWTYTAGVRTCTACEHTPLWSRLLSGQTPVVLSNFKATKWMDLNPLLVVNTRSHVNNVSKSYSCFQWCLKMPKASALKWASAMYRFLCSRESKCMLAELIQETKVV